MKRIAVLAAAALLVLGSNSCILDPKEEKPFEPPQTPYKPLDGERDNVLFNLQKAYNERNLERYDELLDADFIFFYGKDDLASGVVKNPTHNRAQEIQITRNLFDPNFSKPGVDPASDIDLSLTYAAGDDKWVELPAPDPVKYPDETWYEKVVRYSLSVKSGSRELVGQNLQASFVVRWATDQGGKKYWRIVMWRDDTE